MKVRELINVLLDKNQDAEVVMSSDGEGNSFSPLDSVETGFYFEETNWSGMFFSEDEEEELDEEEASSNPGVVLWPIN